MAYDPLLLQAGDLRNPITITETTTTRDSRGTPIETTVTILTTRASIRATIRQSYKQQIQNDVISAQPTFLITIRWPGASINITPDMNVVFGEKTYLIQAVENVLERNRIVKLYCLQTDGGSNR